MLVLGRIKLSTYAITPGDAQPVGPLIHVKGLDNERNADRIMLTDVYLSQLTALSWITTQFQSHVEYVNASDLTEPGVPVSQLDAQGFVDMDQSKTAAKVAALTALGWKIPSDPAGATVYAVASNSPALGELNVGDRVVGVGNAAVHDSCDLVRLTRSLPAGANVQLEVRVATISDTGVIILGRTRTISVHTAIAPSTLGVPNCPGVSGKATSYLGIVPEDAIDYTFPGTIAISTPNIGGPSAGLAMTLGLMDRLSGGSLTGHLPIAATGTIDPSGAVGDVGGVAEKTVAVEREGAKVFFVPESETTVAKNASNGSLKVVGVSTLAQALSALHNLGGASPVPLTKPYPLGAAT